MNNVKNFFNKYLIIGTILYFCGICLSKYIPDFVGVIILIAVAICLILNIKHNFQIYNNYKKILYLLLLFIFCFVVFITSSFIGLLFFTDLSKL